MTNVNIRKGMSSTQLTAPASGSLILYGGPPLMLSLWSTSGAMGHRNVSPTAGL
jgi:hypothetical protein